MHAYVLCFFIFTIAFSFLTFGQNEDSIRIYYLDQVNVFGKKYTISKNEFPTEKDNLSSVLESRGFSIIRKGVFLAQDIYADGMKRGDIPIVIDGERYHNACPMRMDAPISRVNPIEIESIELVKSSLNLQSGLGGVVSIHRSLPQNDFQLNSNITQIVGNVQGTDLSLLTEKLNHRLSVRYAEGLPHKNGDGKSFSDLYGYKGNTKFNFGEAAFSGVTDNWKYSASFMYSGDISFPYLQMDERVSKVYNASLTYEKYKIYFSYTDHLMNNSLRNSPMFMETDAKNITIGLTADFFEVYYRHWNADNKIVSANPIMQIYNNNIPKINLYAANIQQKLGFSGFDLIGKAGFSFFNLGNKGALTFHKLLYKDAKANILFPTFSLSMMRAKMISDEIALSGMIDIASESPEAEALFINVKRMMNKPYWSGNPTLDQPLRTTLRTNLSTQNTSIDLFGSYIFNYVYIASAAVGTQKYQTFSNVNALIAGISLSADYDYIQFNASYTYGQNETSKKPLTEILPFKISTKLTTPKFLGMEMYLKHTYENAQARIDESLFEVKSSTWNIFDLGITSIYKELSFSIDIENVGNLNYSKHLSYVRDPFLSGFKIHEPGTNVRCNVRYFY